MTMRFQHKPICAVYDPTPSACDCGGIVEISRSEYRALRDDAARYRWLRDNSGQQNRFEVEIFIEGEMHGPGHLEAQVDAAMRGDK
ncbi:MAG TPA: hypothetical protein VEA39_00495 [Methylophilaceae bacterium]|nr:hypothetical protein [Methylophilaceae bacterium]